MKKLVFCVILCYAIAANAGISAGLSFQFYLISDNAGTINNTAPSTTSTDTKITFAPVLRIPLSPVSEIDPTIGFSSNSTTSFSEVFLGCGLFYQFVKNGIFSMSTGPAFSATFETDQTANIVVLYMPLNFDFQINQTWSIRASTTVAQIKYEYYETGLTKHNVFIWNLITDLSPAFSVFYTF